MNNLNECTESTMQIYKLNEYKKISLLEGESFISPFPERYILTALAQLPILVHFIIDFSFFSIKGEIVFEWLVLSFYFLSLYLYLWLILSQPGIIHKINMTYEHDEDFLQIPVNSKVTDRRSCVYSLTARSFQHRIKFCKTCNIYRPPRAIHCDSCGFCIQQYNHHSEWLGVCIGLRNFNRYFLFIISCSITLLLVMVSSVIIIRSDIGNQKGYEEYPYSIAACVYSCLLMVYFIPLTVLQFYLLIKNQTFQQFYQSLWQTDSGNPFYRPMLSRIGTLFDAPSQSRFQLNSLIFLRKKQKVYSNSLPSNSHIEGQMSSRNEFGGKAVSDSSSQPHGGLDLLNMINMSIEQ